MPALNSPVVSQRAAALANASRGGQQRGRWFGTLAGRDVDGEYGEQRGGEGCGVLKDELGRHKLNFS